MRSWGCALHILEFIKHRASPHACRVARFALAHGNSGDDAKATSRLRLSTAQQCGVDVHQEWSISSFSEIEIMCTFRSESKQGKNSGYFQHLPAAWNLAAHRVEFDDVATHGHFPKFQQTCTAELGQQRLEMQCRLSSRSTRVAHDGPHRVLRRCSSCSSRHIKQ